MAAADTPAAGLQIGTLEVRVAAPPVAPAQARPALPRPPPAASAQSRIARPFAAFGLSQS
jgi:hypothetical protein